MPKVHLLPRGESIAPMPPRAYGDLNRKTQGGLPPEPYRTATTRWLSCPAMTARDPMKTLFTDWRGVRR
jgi:hypothetical protein